MYHGTCLFSVRCESLIEDVLGVFLGIRSKRAEVRGV
jgi:hypothetical protein